MTSFHDSDIAILNRSVPTPETADVPLALQMLASIRAPDWAANVYAAFTQGIKPQREQQLCVTPPPGGIPGED